MRRHNKLNYDNKIALIEERMKDHQYSDNLKAERLGLEKILSKDQFLQLQEHMRELHMSKSEKEYEKKFHDLKLTGKMKTV